MNSYVILHRDKVAVAVDLMSATSSSLVSDARGRLSRDTKLDLGSHVS